jgi:radical SAM superfamily enzyme YgiQ (UPF0313 family)
MAHHVGGLLKVAPEHLDNGVLGVMRKPAADLFVRFLQRFHAEGARLGKRYHVVPYLMAAHPGSTLSAMVDVALFLKRNGIRVEQVQEFTPTPGTLSTCIHATGVDPLTGRNVYVCRGDRDRRLQKDVLLWHAVARQPELVAALERAGRGEAAAELFGSMLGGRPPQRRLPAKKP